MRHSLASMVGSLACSALVLISVVAAQADPALDALVAAYPDHLQGYDARDLIWKDGTRMPLSSGPAGRSFDRILDNPDILDQFSIPYRLGKAERAPEPNEDPGRIRNEAFFAKMYGDCRRGEVTHRTRPVRWLPSRGGGTLMVTTVNGVADRLSDVSRELDKLPASFTKYLVPSAGVYNCRPVAKTNRLSVHAFGAAIDVSTRFSDYWLWSKGKAGEPAYRNRIPQEIVDVFESHGFVWGGKWYHFDTMHFEYRPEIVELAKSGWPR